LPTGWQAVMKTGGGNIVFYAKSLYSELTFFIVSENIQNCFFTSENVNLFCSGCFHNCSSFCEEQNYLLLSELTRCTWLDGYVLQTSFQNNVISLSRDLKAITSGYQLYFLLYYFYFYLKVEYY